MRVETYDPTDMSIISSDATGVDFGETLRGQHSPNVVAVRPIATIENFTALALFLQDGGGLDHSLFGKYKSSTATQGITPGSNYLSDYFLPVSGIEDASMIGVYSDYGLVFNPAAPEYAWMDAEVSVYETTVGNSSVNFRFVFEYN